MIVRTCRLISALLLTIAAVSSSSPCRGAEGPYVEITAELVVDDWSYHLLEDRRPAEDDRRGTLFGPRQIRRCVVGPDSWLIETKYEGRTLSYWFTGSNIFTYSEQASAASPKVKPFSLATSQPPPGKAVLWNDPSPDGNPGRPVRVADIMPFDLSGRIFWLAYCSGPCLRRPGRVLYPSSSFWKEYYGPSQWTEHTAVFPDGLGLPRSVDFIETNSQPIFQYRAHGTTNFLGYSFPREFYVVGYDRAPTNGAAVEFTAKGRLLGIKPAARPEIPAALLGRAEHSR
jgi:hypothetical protein